MSSFMRSALAALMIAALALAVSAPGAAQGDKPEEVVVFAAASLTNALQDVAEVYRVKTGQTVKFSFASSSVLAKQVENGAPAHIFASADEKWMDYLAHKGLILTETRLNPIGNSLVLIAPADSKIAPFAPSAATDLSTLLGSDGRLAVGDPAHVPAGTYAMQAFEKLGLWAAAEPRLARADNVRAALALVETGEAPLGVVYATDAASTKKVKTLGVFPKDSHAPIVYPMAILKGQDSKAALALFKFMTGPDGLKIFIKYGFTPVAGA